MASLDTRTRSPEADRPPDRETGFRSLSFQFLSRILPILLAVSLLFMAVFGYLTRRAALEQIDEDVVVFASSLTKVLDNLMWSFQTEEMVSALATISANPSMLGAEILQQDGTLLLSYGITPELGTSGLLSARKPISKRMPDGERTDLGWLVLYYTHAAAEREFLRLFLEQFLGLCAIIAIITLGSVYAFGRTVSRPLRELLDSINEVDGSGRWVQVDWRSRDEIGEVIRAHNRMIRHIEAKENALAESEKRHRMLFDNALVGILQVYQDGRVINANRTVAELLGHQDVPDLSQVDVNRYYHDLTDRERLWKRLKMDGEVSHFRARFRRADGRRIWLEIAGKLNPDGSFNGILQDVTAQEEARKAVAERDELHRAFFEENKAVMLLHDPMTSAIHFANQAACHYYGYSIEELAALTIRDLDCMSDAEIYEELRQASKERRGYFKHTHTLKDGTRRDVEVFTGPVSMGNRQFYYSIVHDVTEKRRLEARLERMATRDQLTGAYNRHAFFQMAKTEFVRTKRFRHPLAMLMFDLDHFKQVNDTHGHAVGDEVLRGFALRCRADLRESDVFARLGGEEFAAMLVETDHERALEVAERIRRITAGEPLPTEVGQLTVTVSIGVVSLTDEADAADLLKKADLALYKAKEGGRDSVVSL